MHADTLRARLSYEPEELRFGTSGRRGKVVDLTQLEVYINATAELEFLTSLPEDEGGVRSGGEIYFARDLRPSSALAVEEEQGRGGIAQAIVAAIRDAGFTPVNLGQIPTPALAAHALARRSASMMITGSHIPFDRNGYKTNTARGELLKHHEAPINQRVAEVRRRLYEQPFSQSAFNERGMFKDGLAALPAESPAGPDSYLRRYTSFFPGLPLAGMKLLAYQHSAVGRDLLVEILEALGAEVRAAGRSETFVPIDTENIDAAQLAVIQKLLDNTPGGPFAAIVSTDGDSDRPLVLGVDAAGQARFFGGDLLGMVVAEWLKADAVVVPISCNDAIDRGPLAPVLEPKTRIGSPYVIAGMEAALARGRRRVCGWEANGGFLTGSEFQRGAAPLPALPTRDALLPMLGVLAAAKEKGVPPAALFDALPARYSRAALLRNFPRATALKILERYTPQASDGSDLSYIAASLGEFFPAEQGFGAIERIDTTDGVRILFDNGDVAHVRPSGNADELRIYAVADTQPRADRIAALGVAEPEGILRRMEQAVSS
ncbi:MAG: phosphomannomutase [Acidobacteria bacterium]|nr:phosphomannomutase [Acidobacteriota bacterium]